MRLVNNRNSATQIDFFTLTLTIMTKHLLIMRHAKSSWAEEGLSDFDRPLNKRGKRVAPEMARYVFLQGLVPDMVVSSSANRAQKTAKIFVKNCEGCQAEQLTLTDDFYHAPASIYLERLQQISDESINIVLFVGHNPGLESLVEILHGEWEQMPTSAVAHFEIQAESWDEVNEHPSAILKNLWRPKDLGIY